MEKLNELVELAKKATLGRNPDRLESCGGGIKYQCLGDDGSLVLQCDHKNDEYGFIGPKSLEDEAFFLACNPDTILAIAEAFRALEQRAEAAEADLAELEKQEPVAYWHRSGQVVTREESHNDKIFAICCKVERPLFTRPAPAADLAELVPDAKAIRKEAGGYAPVYSLQEQQLFIDGATWLRAANLRNIEEAKK